jgi:hypothetical protein
MWASGIRQQQQVFALAPSRASPQEAPPAIRRWQACVGWTKPHASGYACTAGEAGT